MMTRFSDIILRQDAKFGFLEPDCTIAKIKNATLKLMSPYGLGSSSWILLNIMNPNNKLKIILDSNFGLDCLVATLVFGC